MSTLLSTYHHLVYNYMRPIALFQSYGAESDKTFDIPGEVNVMLFIFVEILHGLQEIIYF